MRELGEVEERGEKERFMHAGGEERKKKGVERDDKRD